MPTIQTSLPLSDLTFYGVGGPAHEVWFVESAEEFAPLWAEAIEQEIPRIVLGKGSNTLFADQGYKGRVFIPQFQATRWQGPTVTVEAGKSFPEFIEETNDHGFEDLCLLSGIPGNVGGFVRGNAGALGTDIAATCMGVEYVDETGSLQKIAAEKADFDYRHSIFKTQPNWAIVRATFRLSHSTDPESARTKTKEITAQRWAKNPAGRSGGCLFKNPEGHIAGKLLDECGAKGDRSGDAQISPDHANFFINKGQATQRDILHLARKWKTIVREKTGIKLEPEIFICDEQGKKVQL